LEEDVPLVPVRLILSIDRLSAVAEGKKPFRFFRALS
jgi:hypothetical protein